MSIHCMGNSRDEASTARAKPIGVKPKRACAMLDCGRTRLYELLNSGQLVSYKDGVSRKITVASIHAYVARLIEVSRQNNPPSHSRTGAHAQQGRIMALLERAPEACPKVPEVAAE